MGLPTRTSYTFWIALYFVSCVSAPVEETAGVWITTANQAKLLEKQESLSFADEPASDLLIEIQGDSLYQTIQGFGFALTGGSAAVINQLGKDKCEELLQELFTPDGIDISYLRISIGASDLDESPFSYDDLPAGETDPGLSHFSLARDTLDLVPLLQRIIRLKPTLKIMGSPWSAPAWMKTNQSTIGGRLREEYYEAYAKYFVKYIEAMSAHGIAVDAITLQNEPEHPGNNPSMLMSADEQAKFVKDYLGPLFNKHGLTTRIVVYDHNCDHPEYPIGILNDSTARLFIDGSAFHLYLGEISALSKVHRAHPDKNVYFTEQWTSSEGDFGDDLLWHVTNLIIGATQNWSVTVIEWNLASDPTYGPHTEGGCTMCKGALTIGDRILRNVSYYVIAHASKFVPPGSKRILATSQPPISSVAFKTPTDETVLILLNEAKNEVQMAIRSDARYLNINVPAEAAVTLKW